MASHDISKLVDGSGDEFNFRDPTKESLANKVTSVRAPSSATDTNYPSEKAVADKLLDYALVKKTYGKQGYISYSAADADILIEKIKLGSLSLYNEGVTVKVYEFDEDDEENAVLVWDSSTLTGNELYQYRNGLQMSNIYISPAGKWVKVSYTGSTSSYIRALGIFMTPKYADSSHVAFAKLRLNDAEYDWNRIATYGSLVTAVVTDSTKTTCDVIFKPESSAVRMRFFGFRCLNTYTGSDAVLLGRSTSTLKLYTARKLKTNLARTSDSTFDGSADQLNIPVTGTLPVGNGGTGKSSVTSGNYLVGNGTSAFTEKTPKDAGSDVLKSLDTDNGDVVDGDYIVTSYHVDASTISSTTFVRRTAEKLWNYIKSKISSVLGLSTTGYTGNAATATTAKDYDTSTGTIQSALAGKSDTGHVHNTDANEVTSDDTNLGDATDGMQFVTTYADNTGYSSQHKELYRRPGIKIWNWIKSKIDSYTGVVHTTGDETVQGLKTFSNTTTGNDLDINLQSVTNNGTYKMGVEVAASGRRGLWDYSGTGISGEGKWIIYKDTDNVVHVGDDSSQRSKVKIGGITLDFSGTVGTAANTLYIV